MDRGGGLSKWWWQILLIVCLLWGFIHGAKSRYAIQNQTRTWWDASGIGCDSFGGKLLTLKGPDLPYQVSNILHDHRQQYWLGAIEFSTWRWSDGSSLYKYEGYINASDIYEAYPTKMADGNSALQCHSLCKNKSRLFGLQGIRCICLSKPYILGIVRKHTEELENACTGNLNERCGNEYGISVYSIDSFFPDTVESADCIYVVKSYFSLDNQYTIHAANCYHRKCAVCSNYDRIQTWQQNWNDWNRTCQLFKLTDNTMQSLEAFIQRNPCYWNFNGYWIGLRRHNNQKWLDGTNFNMHVWRPNTHNYPRCLAIEYHRGGWEPFWAPCTNRYIPVCEIVNKTIISPTTRLQVTTHATTAFAKPSTAALSTVKFPTTTDNTSVIGQPYKHKTNPRRDEHQSSKAGVIVGSCIGVIALLTILVLFALTYRQKRFCFKTYQNKDERVYFDPAGDGDASNRQITQPTANRVYSIPVATVRPVYQNMSFIEDNAQSGDEYYNVPAGHKDKNSGYEGFDFGKHLGSDGGADHHYEVPKPFSGAHENKDHAENQSRDQIYDSFDSELDEGEQDGKTVQEDNDTNVYCLAGQLNEEEEGEEEEEKVDLGSETQNVENCNYGSVWDSTNQTAAPNDDYNTTGQPKAKMSPGNMYSHLRHPQTHLSDNEDAEYAYDTPWFRPDESLNNDYNHTGEFISLHGEGLASCNGNENKEDGNSPVSDGVIRHNQQRPNIPARIYENTRMRNENSGTLQRHTSDA